MAVYIDDMVVKAMEKHSYLANLSETFGILRKYKMKLNASKCAFNIGSDKFHGYIVNHRGIEANPGQIMAILELGSPRSVKEVLADFVAEFTGSLANFKFGQVQTKPDWRMYLGDIWQMYCDGSSNQRGSGAGVVIMTPDGAISEQSIKLGFDASNNEAEYEALLTGL
ncbi:uncharacterized protein LOC114274934 [Camellia sinensis]|uniref:uncharacterized protein LOC114274934 n=1 Tax=Camellia sinensis TaxID=4442 RepID=UPI001036BECB|nr:uncharacterized protein LOC114274934 [Camellia sinensis]